MLGSLHDAEDALQDTLLRAWRGLARLRGPQLAAQLALPHRDERVPQPQRADSRSGCCRSTTCRRRSSTRCRGGRSPSRSGSSRFPIGDLREGFASPEARYELRESVELAFVAALQHLSPQNRAVLILAEVLGFSAAEIADELETTVASVNERAAAGAQGHRGARSGREPAVDAAVAGRRGGPRDRRSLRGCARGGRRRRGARPAGRGRDVVDAATVELVPGQGDRRRVPHRVSAPGQVASSRLARERPGRGRLLRLGRGARLLRRARARRADLARVADRRGHGLHRRARRAQRRAARRRSRRSGAGAAGARFRADPSSVLPVFP